MECHCFLLISLALLSVEFVHLVFCFCFINENKDLSYSGTGIFQGPGTVSFQGFGGHFMKEIFVFSLACLEIGFQVRLQFSPS